MVKQTLITALQSIEAVKRGAFKLKSGQMSNIYVDMRRVISFPEIMKLVAQHVAELIKPLTFDAICGVPYSAIPYATTISTQFNIPLLMIRKQTKSHGTKQLLEGVYRFGQRALVIEDVVTTGKSLLEVVKQLECEGIKVEDVVCLVDREEGARELLTSQGYRVHTLLTLSELIGVEVDATVDEAI